MTSQEIKDHADVQPARKEMWSYGSALILLQIIGTVLFVILPFRDALRDVVESNRLLKAQFDAHMDADTKKWEAVYQKDLREAGPNAEMRRAVQRIDSYFDSNQRRR